MCHKSIEKAIKAYHWKKIKTEPAYIHDLDRLAEKAELLPELNDKQLDFLDELNPHNIEARYPKSKEEILKTLTKQRCTTLMKQTKELLEWIKNRP